MSRPGDIGYTHTSYFTDEASVKRTFSTPVPWSVKDVDRLREASKIMLDAIYNYENVTSDYGEVVHARDALELALNDCREDAGETVEDQYGESET